MDEYQRATMTWEDELVWAVQHAKGKSSKTEVYRMMLAAVVYHIWRERNVRISIIKDNYQMLFPSSSSKEIHIKAGNQSHLANGWTIKIPILGQYAFLCHLDSLLFCTSGLLGQCPAARSFPLT